MQPRLIRTNIRTEETPRWRVLAREIYWSLSAHAFLYRYVSVYLPRANSLYKYWQTYVHTYFSLCTYSQRSLYISRHILTNYCPTITGLVPQYLQRYKPHISSLSTNISIFCHYLRIFPRPANICGKTGHIFIERPDIGTNMSANISSVFQLSWELSTNYLLVLIRQYPGRYLHDFSSHWTNIWLI